MSELSKRSAKYFFIQGLKWSGYVVLLQLVLCLEWYVLGVDEEGGALQYSLGMMLSLGGFFTALLNGIFAIYGPNWYDSLALSMGARRKDVFWGELIKQLTFVVASTVFYIILILITNQFRFINYTLLAAVFAIVVGPIGLVIGHKIKKYGKIFIVIIATFSGLFGMYVGMSSVTGSSALFALPEISILLVVLVAALLFVLFELWVYKLNSKCMVI